MPSTPSGATSTPPKASKLAAWDASAQQRYRSQAQIPRTLFLLDRSGSMEACRKDLVVAYNLTLQHLMRVASPLMDVETWLFNHDAALLAEGALYQTSLLSAADYLPGGGTRLRRALQQVLARDSDRPAMRNRPHLLIVFTDGLDSECEPALTQAVHDLMTARQSANWLCVYLGAYPEALAEGLRLGFTEGNCLRFERYYLAEAFAQLREGLTKYLRADTDERKLLTTGGIFAEPQTSRGHPRPRRR